MQSAPVIYGVFFTVNPRDVGLVYPFQFSVQGTDISVVIGAMVTDVWLLDLVHLATKPHLSSYQL